MSYWYKTQETCDSVFTEDPFMITSCCDRCKTQWVCNEAVEDCLAALRFVPDWFVASKMFQKFLHALLANDNILVYIHIYYYANNNDMWIRTNEYLLVKRWEKTNRSVKNAFTLVSSVKYGSIKTI